MWLLLHWGEGVTCELWGERCWCWSGRCWQGGHCSYLQHPDMRLWELRDSLEAQKPSNCSCPVCQTHQKGLSTVLSSRESSPWVRKWRLAIFFCKKLLKSRSAPNAELISACRATHCCQQRLWGILKHSWYLLVNHLVIIYRKEEKRAQGTSSFQPGASSSETKGKTPEICHQNLPMTGLGFKVGMGELGRLNWDLIYMEKVRWKGRLLPQTLKHKWRSEYKKRFLGNHHGLKIELFLSTGVPVLRTVW